MAASRRGKSPAGGAGGQVTVGDGARRSKWRTAGASALATVVLAAAASASFAVHRRVTGGAPRAGVTPASGTSGPPAGPRAAVAWTDGLRDLSDRSAPAVLRVGVTTCNGFASGTGFAVGEGLVITAAHVVGDAAAIELSTDSELVRGVAVIDVDEAHDVAVLAAAGLRVPALRLTAGSAGPPASAASGTSGTSGVPAASGVLAGLGAGAPANTAAAGGPYPGAPADGIVIGRPLGTIVDRPFRLEATAAVTLTAGAPPRALSPALVLAAHLEAGHSGAPLLRPDGEVIGMAVAVDEERPDTAYATPSSVLAPLVAEAAARASSAPPGPHAGMSPWGAPSCRGG